MGLLSLGTPLSWNDGKKYADHVRAHGITQFLYIWDRLKDRQGDELLWGDEVEYMVVAFDDQAKTARLSLRQSEILQKLSNVVAHLEASNDIPQEFNAVPLFHPEYGRYMLESTPGAPYTGSLTDLLSVELNMRYRRKLARRFLKPHEIPLTVTSFPRLGAPGIFTEPYFDPVNATASHSLFLPHEITNPHARFPTLTANIRSRRGSKVAINLPIFVDEKTPRPFVDPTIPWDRNVYPEDPEAKDGAALVDHIYMDAMGFGMGCCCLQLTFQSCNVAEARRVYDALVPVGPIMLALTAASPAWRGYLADVDCRWNVIAGSVDDRTEEERGLKPLKENKFRIPKSRYDSVDSYLSQDWRNRPEYNDNPSPYDEEIYDRLRNHGIDHLLAKHVAHLFIRDPLVVFSEMVDQDDSISSDHFENLQSTNWQTLRFKPPPPNSSIGWRVEFRSMEVQITDFENAAFSAFIVLLSRAILSLGLNFYIPISKVDENMNRAQKRDAVREQKFYFRKNVLAPGRSMDFPYTEAATDNTHAEAKANSPYHSHAPIHKDKVLRNCYPDVQPPEGLERPPVEEEYEEMTINEIINGKKGHCFPGLMGVVNAYVNSLDVEFAIKDKLRKYLNLVKHRADGSLVTTATWMRNFIRSHPNYKFDSVISDEINYDLMKAIDDIERGVRQAPELLPEDHLNRVNGL
ncbi:glutamate-cysteine ligase-domain-containing protein [Hysterangium stoloniferum]|nr:glutamate-cysteine ligase-domain-containing protein [Hysterangium stoloniferum]